MIKSFETNHGTVIIREANEADIEKYRALRLFALQESPIAFGADYDDTLNQSPAYWSNRIREDDASVMFIAEHGQDLIGMTGILRRNLPKTKHSATIIGVYVHPTWRGLRIANSMIDSCITWARSKEVNIVKLGVNAANSSALHCYERCGFKIYGTEPRGTFHDGRYYDGFLMYQDLQQD